MAAVATSPRAFLPVLLLVAIATPSAAAGARLTTTAGLAERLYGGEGAEQQYCWESLMAIRSCTGEIILFFLNGEAYLGPGCCRAIRVIERRCWAADAMLSVIGFTPEEGDMLKGYCDDNSNAEGHHRPIGGSRPAPPPTNPALDGVATTGASTAPPAAAVAAAGRKGMVAVRHQLGG